MEEKSLRKILAKIAGEIAGYLRDIIEEKDLAEVVGEGAGGDKTRKVDKLAEDMIVELVRSENLPARIVTEERGIIDIVDKPRYLLIVDPLDGSINYLAKIPYAAVSVAITYIDKPYSNYVIAGAVANIFLNEIYSFDETHAYIDNVLVNQNELGDPVGKVIVVYTRNPEILYILKDFSRKYIGVDRIRVLGSASLEIVYTGLNRILMFINDMGSLRNIDIIAGLKFVEKLGKKVVDIHGKPLSFRLDKITKIDSIVVGNSFLIDKFIELVKDKGYVQDV